MAPRPQTRMTNGAFSRLGRNRKVDGALGIDAGSVPVPFDSPSSSSVVLSGCAVDWCLSRSRHQWMLASAPLVIRAASLLDRFMRVVGRVDIAQCTGGCRGLRKVLYAHGALLPRCLLQLCSARRRQ